MNEIVNAETVSIFPWFKSVQLIYRMSDDGIGTRVFHKCCDNKGSTVTFIKANKHFVFGGYNP
jgi:hypothetical protein